MTDEESKFAEAQILLYSKKIDFFTSEYTVEILASKIASEDYTVPSYQREFTWDTARKSKFIESLIMGLPIPFVFFWQNDITGKLEIVDGSQRLRTLEEYLGNRLNLEGLERLDLLNGSSFLDLQLSRRRKILNRSIRGIILSENTDMESRIDLFERINTGSKVANPTEVRRGVLRGPFMNFINKTAQMESFIEIAPVSAKQKKEREREELVSRFFAYSDGLDDYKDDVSAFLFRYIKRMNKEFEEHPELENEYERKFQLMVNFVKNNFEHGFRKNARSKTSPRARFEAISIGSYKAIIDRPDINVNHEQINDIVNSQEFKLVVRSDGANAIKNLRSRINFIHNKLLGMA